MAGVVGAVVDGGVAQGSCVSSIASASECIDQIVACATTAGVGGTIINLSTAGRPSESRSAGAVVFVETICAGCAVRAGRRGTVIDNTLAHRACVSSIANAENTGAIKGACSVVARVDDCLVLPVNCCNIKGTIG